MNVAVAVLAGGASRRMGRDKGLAPVAGKPMALWAAEAALAAVGWSPAEVLIVSNQPGYETIAAVLQSELGTRGSGAEVRVLSDIRPGLGPLAGIETALTETNAESVLVIACDLPLADPQLIADLVSAVPPALAAMPSGPSGPEPCLATYSRECLPIISGLLDEDRLEARGIAEAIRERDPDAIRIAESAGFAAGVIENINTPEDFSLAEMRLASRSPARENPTI